MRVYGTYGLNCDNDLSQKVYQQIFDHYGLSDLLYQVMNIPPVAVNGAIESLRQAEFAGVTILWPYQEYITELVDEKDHLAELAFCANTIVGHSQLLSGHNTNGIGFLNALQQVANYDLKGKKVLLLGAGAIARTIAVVAAENGAKEIIMANRTNDRGLENAMDLAAKIATPIKGCGWDHPNLGEYIQNSDLVVNCTFLGDASHLGEVPVPQLLNNLHQGQLVVDVTINPASTNFLAKAKEQGAAILPGYFILLYQILATYKLWTLEDVPVNLVQTILETELGIKA